MKHKNKLWTHDQELHTSGFERKGINKAITMTTPVWQKGKIEIIKKAAYENCQHRIILENHPEIPKSQCNCSRKTPQQEPSAFQRYDSKIEKQKKEKENQQKKPHPAAKHRWGKISNRNIFLPLLYLSKFFANYTRHSQSRKLKPDDQIRDLIKQTLRA